MKQQPKNNLFYCDPFEHINYKNERTQVSVLNHLYDQYYSRKQSTHLKLFESFLQLVGSVNQPISLKQLIELNMSKTHKYKKVLSNFFHFLECWIEETKGSANIYQSIVNQPYKQPLLEERIDYIRELDIVIKKKLLQVKSNFRKSESHHLQALIHQLKLHKTVLKNESRTIENEIAKHNCAVIEKTIVNPFRSILIGGGKDNVVKHILSFVSFFQEEEPTRASYLSRGEQKLVWSVKPMYQMCDEFYALRLVSRSFYHGIMNHKPAWCEPYMMKTKNVPREMISCLLLLREYHEDRIKNKVYLWQPYSLFSFTKSIKMIMAKNHLFSRSECNELGLLFPNTKNRVNEEFCEMAVRECIFLVHEMPIIMKNVFEISSQ
jgi:hypothetical protein